MMNHIDVSIVLRQTIACDLYSNLVTRPTGAAVRGQIQALLSTSRDRALTVIDFSRVSMIDFSCADEVVAKLLLHYGADDCPHEAYFLFRGVTDDHWDPIESVLERHGLALAMETDGAVRVVGVLAEIERRIWEATYAMGRANAIDLLDAGISDPEEIQSVLDSLWRRRLVMRVNDHYVAVGSPRG